MSKLTITINPADGSAPQILTFDGDRLSIQDITLQVEAAATVVVPPPVVIPPVPLTLSGTSGATVSSPIILKGTAPVGSTVQVFDVFTPAVVVVSPPVTPTGLTGTTLTAGVTLTWNSTPAATSYGVYKNSIKLATSTSTTFIDTSVIAGFTYVYNVTAVGTGGESSKSSPISVTIPTPVVVTPPPITIPNSGVWTNVTPSNISLVPNALVIGGQSFNFGAQDIVADPNNPGTLIAAFTYQGIWKSKDYGLTWTKLTNNGVLVPLGTTLASTDPMDNGRPSMVIAPDGSRILSTLLYPTNGISNGCWISKATDVGGLGAAWRRVDVPGVPNADDIGSFDFDPADSLHAICFSHSPTPNFWESVDGGETWKAQPLPAGGPVKLRFVSPGHLMAGWDWGSNINPQVGTVNSGIWTWQPTTAKDENGNTVAGQTSFHGAQQVLFDAVNNATYIGGPEGVQRSTDAGRLNWTKLSTPDSLSSGIVATTKNIYSTSTFASSGGFQVNFQFGPRDPKASGTTWKAVNVPAGMSNGWFSASVVNDGTHTSIVAGCWNAGIWRYTE